jgi:ribosomal protein L7Ae-like RNA K-turn-binding protein
MTVKELIKELQKRNGALLVVMAKDAEGNSFSPLCEAETYLYVPNNAWSGEVYNMDYAEVAEGKAVKAVVLWPFN